ncbi:hypothetical protein AVEN_92310-1 [Araneus ventricosus]|uniref:Uncharacterized protein n=1 Tax=Araneus ventricosus TaxID=182803 RepID=A0A4Y2AKN8_ARAVE|nr:hypothetical protein AVEN_92310-1 [Araneus ventricosus]
MVCTPGYYEFVFLFPSNPEGWCRQHVNWIVSDWGNVMFTDESRFALQPDDKRVRVRREQGTRNRPENITEHHAFRGGNIMVWAGISSGHRTDLHVYCV